MEQPAFEVMDLTNVGELRAQFEEALAEVGQCFEESDRYETDSHGVTTVKVTLEIEFRRQIETHNLSIDTRANVRLPKKRAANRGAFYQGGAFTIAKFQQANLPLTGPTPIRARALNQE